MWKPILLQPRIRTTEQFPLLENSNSSQETGKKATEEKHSGGGNHQKTNNPTVNNINTDYREHNLKAMVCKECIKIMGVKKKKCPKTHSANLQSYNFCKVIYETSSSTYMLFKFTPPLTVQVHTLNNKILRNARALPLEDEKDTCCKIKGELEKNIRTWEEHL